MVSATVKLLLSLLICSLGFRQKNMGKEIASLFCFIICALLFLGFLFDIIRLIRQKLKDDDTPAPHTAAVPNAGDYPDTPDPSDLKIGRTYRAADVNRYLDNIQKLKQDNPDYALSESELIDNYLTDKKIWKYTYRLRTVTLQILKGQSREEESIGVFAEGLQIGRIHTADCPRLLKAMKSKGGVEVVYCTVGGGPYKIVHDDARTGKYSMVTDEKPYSVTMSIYQK